MTIQQSNNKQANTPEVSAATPETAPSGSYWQAVREFSPNAKAYLAASALIQVCLGLFNVIFNLYLSGVGYSLTVISGFATAQMLGSALTAIPAGMFSDRVGRKKSLLVATTLGIISTLGQVFLTQSASLLLVLAFARGAATGFQMTLSGPFLMENSRPRERMHLFSANMSLTTLAMTTGSLLAGWLPVVFAASFGWQGAADPRSLRTALLASISFLAFAYVPTLMISERRSGQARSSGRLIEEMKATIANANVKALVIFNILIGFGAGLVLPLFNMFLKRQLSATPTQISLVMTGSQLVLAGATLLSPFLVKWLGRIRAVVITQLLSIPFLLTIALTRSIYSAAFAYWLRSAFMNLSSPISSSLTMEIVDPQRRATTNGLTQLFSNLSRAAAITVAGIMMERFGDNTPYFGTAVLYVTASCFYYFCFRKYESHGVQGTKDEKKAATA